MSDHYWADVETYAECVKDLAAQDYNDGYVGQSLAERTARHLDEVVSGVNWVIDSARAREVIRVSPNHDIHLRQGLPPCKTDEERAFFALRQDVLEELDDDDFFLSAPGDYFAEMEEEDDDWEDDDWEYDDWDDIDSNQ